MKETDYTTWIGKKVHKFSKASTQVSPFKSGLKNNTVKGLVPHKELSALKGETIQAFTFEEDGSYIACHKCLLAE